MTYTGSIAVDWAWPLRSLPEILKISQTFMLQTEQSDQTFMLQTEQSDSNFHVTTEQILTSAPTNAPTNAPTHAPTSAKLQTPTKGLQSRTCPYQIPSPKKTLKPFSIEKYQVKNLPEGPATTRFPYVGLSNARQNHHSRRINQP